MTSAAVISWPGAGVRLAARAFAGAWGVKSMELFRGGGRLGKRIVDGRPEQHGRPDKSYKTWAGADVPSLGHPFQVAKCPVVFLANVTDPVTDSLALERRPAV